MSISKEDISKIVPRAIKIERFSSGADQMTFSYIDCEDSIKKVIKFGVDREIYNAIVPQLISRGVRVPEVFFIGKYKGLGYVILQFVGAESLDLRTREKNIDNREFMRISESLKRMHQVKGKGFGRVVQGLNSGEFETFHDYIKLDFLSKAEYDTVVVDELITKIESAKQDINETVFTHMDISIDNILLDSNGSHVFLDFGHNAGFNFPEMDIAKAVINDSRYRLGRHVMDQYITGYISNEIRTSAELVPFIELIAIRKLASLKRRGKIERYSDLREWLDEYIHSS